MNIIAHSIVRGIAAICITFGIVASSVGIVALIFNHEYLELEMIIGVLCLVIGLGIEALQKEDIPPPIQFRETR